MQTNKNITKEFLDGLRNKLTYADLRSIYLNCLPGRSRSKIDITSFNELGSDKSSSFLDLLFNKSDFKFNIQIPNVDLNKADKENGTRLSILKRQLSSIIADGHNYYLDTGVKTFSFGYPILVKKTRNKDKVIKAPLLLWSLRLKRTSTRANTWEISREKDYSIKINEKLISYIEKDEGVKLEQIASKYLEDSIIDKNEIIEICDMIISKLDGLPIRTELSLSSNKCIITKFPDKSIIDKSYDKPYILWAGVFGIFKGMKESIIRDYDKLINNSDILEGYNYNDYVLNDYDTSSLFENDPSQEKILSQLPKKNRIIIQGPPGTGKSQTLTTIICNALLNGKKTMIVCEKKTALDIIYKNLEKIGLAGLCALITDVSIDAKNVANKAINKGGNIINSQYSDVHYKLLKDEIDSLKVKINNKYNHLRKEIFDNKNWSDIVGEHLDNHRFQNRDNLKDELNILNFDFNPEEYRKISDILKKGDDFYSKLSNKNSYLRLLNSSIFVGNRYQKTKENSEDQLKNAKNKLNAFPVRIRELILKYQNDLAYDYQKFHQKICDNLKGFYGLFEKYDINNPLYTYFISNNFWDNTKVKIFSYFKPSYSDLLIDKKQIIKSYNELSLISINYKFIHFEFLQFIEKRSMLELLDNINKYRDTFFNWINDSQTSYNNYIREITEQNIYPKSAIKNDILSIIKEYENVVNTLSVDYKIMNLENPSDLIQIEKECSNLLDKIDKILSDWNDYDNYYNWVNFQINLNEIDRQLLNIFSNSNIKDWSKSFKSWYSHQLLKENEPNRNIGNDDLISELMSKEKEFKKIQRSRIINIWSEAASKVNNVREIFFDRINGNGNKTKSLRSIIERNFSSFSDILGV